MPTGGIDAVQNGKSDALMKVAGRGCSILAENIVVYLLLIVSVASPVSGFVLLRY
jgi:hypothetical protein